MENKNHIWRPVSEYTGGRVLATNGFDVLIGKINSEGDCESEEDGNALLCDITWFIKIEEMLNELKESEDEKIRKWIIHDIQQALDDSIYNGKSIDEAKKAIAWLEKQGEQKSEYSDYDLSSVLQGYVPEVMYKFGMPNIERGAIVETAYHFYALGVKQQKPVEWSKVDETYHNYILTNCMNYAEKNGYVKEMNNNYLHQNAKDWLKSLRPQKQWKPSEEQKNALYDVLNPCDDVDKDALVSLYEQLKKLMEV